MAASLLLAGAAKAQIFLEESQANNRLGTETDLGVIPQNGVTLDQTNELYTPLGSGVFVLAALGGAYLLGKKRKK